eukprot:gene33279-biopygen27470
MPLTRLTACTMYTAPKYGHERFPTLSMKARHRDEFTVARQVRQTLGHRGPDEQHKACELASILHSLDNLLTYPWIKRRVDQGKLKLHGWYFDIESGALMAYSARRQQFLPLVCPLTRPT